MSDFVERPSHHGPDDPIPLSCHQADVAERVRAIIPEKARTPEGASLRDLTERVALVHDAGKLTPWFREHLENGSPDGPKHHAPIGALLAHYVLDASGFEGDDPLVGFVAVARHHGSLPDVGSYAYETARGSEPGPLQQYYHDHVPMQAEVIDDTVPELAEDVVRSATGGAGSWAEFRTRIDDGGAYQPVYERVSRPPLHPSPMPNPVPDDFYATVLQVWSALVFADKTGAASLTTGVPLDEDTYRVVPPRRIAVDSYVRNLQRTAALDDLGDRERELNDQRETARRSVRSRAETFVDSEGSVATITLPTGLGKTLAGLDAALTVLEEADGEDGRVVYALPYTSIIDQVAEEAQDVFDTDETGDLLTIHHYLAETLIEQEGADVAEEVDGDELAHVAELLGESWRSGLVVTTFVQLFESLAGPSNSQSMKLPALYGSVVVLDEPQALPLDWWKLVKRLVGILVEEYDATVIAMTATQPHLLDGVGGDEPFELVEDPDQYFEGLDRVQFELDPSVVSYMDGEPEPLSYETAAESLADVLSGASSTLAICNTIDSARELTAELLSTVEAVDVNEVYGERLDGCEATTENVTTEEVLSAALDARTAEEPLLVHLSTRHRPCDRRVLIDVSSTLAERGYPVALVSTQLVEAGVDVSFDHVFRDFAPLDSIVQAAGRCNRSFDRRRGQVTVWLLEPPEGREKTPSSVVYARDGESLTKLTALALDEVWNGGSLSERTVTREAVTDYFRRLDDRNVGKQEYVDCLDKAEAGQLGQLSLIDERRAVDVVVARTQAEWDTVREIWTAFEDAEWDRVDELIEATRDMSVSVPLYASSDAAEKLVDCDPIHPGAERRWIDGRPGRDDSFFDATEGFVIPDSTVEARLL